MERQKPHITTLITGFIVIVLLLFTVLYIRHKGGNNNESVDIVSQNSNQSGISSISEESPTSDQKIPLGFIGPLSGEFSYWGQTIRDGVELALAEVPNTFVPTFKDSECDPRKMILSLQSFITNNPEIKIIIGPACYTNFLTAVEIAHKNNIMLFSPSFLGDRIFKDFDNIINLATQVSGEVDYLTQYLSLQAIDTLSIIHSTGYFGEEYAKSLPEYASKYGVDVKSIHAIDSGRLQDARAKLIEVNPKAIFIQAGEKEFIALATELRDAKYTGIIIGNYEMQTDYVKKQANELGKIIFSAPLLSESDITSQLQFEGKYMAAFGTDRVPSPNSAYVYDGILILEEAVSHCKGVEKKCIRDYFVSKGNISGTSGEMIFHTDGSTSRPFGIKTLESGEFVWEKKYIHQ